MLDQIKERMTKFRITQAELSRMSGISRSLLNQYLGSKAPIPNEKLIKIIETLGGEYIVTEPKIRWVKKVI